MKKIVLFGLLILILNSCSDSKKVTSKFIYENGASSVELKILSGNNYLIYDKPIKANFEWKNIDPQTGVIYGTGIKILKAENEITQTEINVPRSHLQSDTLNIQLRFKINGKQTETEFNVPVKIAE